MAARWSLGAAPPQVAQPSAAAGRAVRSGTPATTIVGSSLSWRSRRPARGRPHSMAGCSRSVAAQTPLASVARSPSARLRVAREFQEWKSGIANHDLVGADLLGWCEAGGPGGRDEIILLDTVSADPEPTHKLTIEVERHAAREEYDSALMICIWRLTSLPTRRRDVVEEELKERAGRRAVDPGRIERLSAEADRAIRHGGPGRDPGEIGRDEAATARVEDVAGLGDGHVDAEDRGVRHAEEASNRSLEIADGDDHSRRAARRKPDSRPRHVGLRHGLADDGHDIRLRELIARHGTDEPAVRDTLGHPRTIEGPDPERTPCDGPGARTGRARGLHDERQLDPIQDDDAGIGRTRTEPCVGNASNERGELRQIGRYARDTDTAHHLAIFEDRHAAARHRCEVT